MCLDGTSADRDVFDIKAGLPDAYRDALSRFAADADTGV
jgi:hypothetical protein